MAKSHNGYLMPKRWKNPRATYRSPKTNFGGTNLPVASHRPQHTTYSMQLLFSPDPDPSELHAPPVGHSCSRSVSLRNCRSSRIRAYFPATLILSDWSVIPSLPEKLKVRRRLLSFFHSPAGAMLTLLEHNSIESLGPVRHPHPLNFSEPERRRARSNRK